MAKIKNIIVPVDFSGHSISSIQVAEVIAGKVNAGIHVVHIIEFPHAPRFSHTADLLYQDELLNNYLGRLKKAARVELEKLTDSARRKGLNIKCTVINGKVFNVVNELLREEEESLLICGIRGEESEAELGSNAEKFVRRMKVPVITVDKVPEDYDIKKVLFASLFSPDERYLFDEARELASALGVSLHAVRINSPKNFLSVDERKTLITQLQQEYDPDPDIEIYSDISEEDGIIRFAAEINADLVIIGTHGREGIFHFFRGSVAEELAGTSSRPVLTLRLNK